MIAETYQSPIINLWTAATTTQLLYIVEHSHELCSATRRTSRYIIPVLFLHLCVWVSDLLDLLFPANDSRRRPNIYRKLLYTSIVRKKKKKSFFFSYFVEGFCLCVWHVHKWSIRPASVCCTVIRQLKEKWENNNKVKVEQQRQSCIDRL
jgi:hypothetical protein